MSNHVNFYKGTHNEFAGLSKYVGGAFYLTTDSQRLYFANDDSTILDLNKYILFKPNVQSLPTQGREGDIYYCVSENVLCTYRGTGWIQININTDTTTTSITTDKEVADETDTITLKFHFEEQSSSTMANSPKNEFDVTWEITREDIYDIIPEPKVDLVASVRQGQYLDIDTTGDGSAKEADGKHGVSLVAGNNIAFTDNKDNTVTIEAAEYTLSSPDDTTNIQLTDNDIDGAQKTQTIQMLAGYELAVDGSDADKITYSHGTITPTERDGSTNTVSQFWGNSVKHLEELDFKDASGKVGNGHVYGYKFHTVDIPDKPTYEITELTAGSGADAGNLTVTIEDVSETGGDSSSKTISKGLYYEIVDDNNISKKFYNTETLPVYTIEQIERRLQGLNAITYKGTVTAGSSTHVLPVIADKVRIGDAYMATKNGAYGNANVKFLNDEGVEVAGPLEHVEAGDLFIATGTETVIDGEHDTTDDGTIANTGYITSGLVWTYVPAGNDYDSQYVLTHNGTTVTLTGNTAVNPDLVDFNGSITFEADTSTNDDLELTVSAADANNSAGDSETPPDADTITVKYKHKEYGETETALALGEFGYGQTVSGFKTISGTSNGHVVETHNTSFILPPAQDVTIHTLDNEPTLTLTDRENAAGGTVKFVSDVGETSKEDIVTPVLTKKDEIKFKHRRGFATAATPATATVQWGENRNIITSVTPSKDGDGHLLSFTSTAIQFPDNPGLMSITPTVTNDTALHTATVKQTFSSPHNESAETINSSTIYVTGTDSLQLKAEKSVDANDATHHIVTVNVDLVWKDFPKG